MLDKNSEWPGYYGAVIVGFFFCADFYPCLPKVKHTTLAKHWSVSGEMIYIYMRILKDIFRYALMKQTEFYPKVCVCFI